MKKLSVLIILAFSCCVGCTTMSQTTDDYVTGIEIAKENAVKLAQISEFKTCFIRAAIGSHIEKLPHEMVMTLDKIDLLMEEIGTDYDTITDCQKGQILGLWTRLVVLGILEVIGEINPGALADLL